MVEDFVARNSHNKGMGVETYGGKAERLIDNERKTYPLYVRDTRMILRGQIFLEEDFSVTSLSIPLGFHELFIFLMFSLLSNTITGFLLSQGNQGNQGKSENLKIGQRISSKTRKFHGCQGKVREFY